MVALPWSLWCLLPLLTVVPIVSAGQAVGEEATVSLELNKLEAMEKACRVYLLLRNEGGGYQSFKLDLVLFGTDGVIARRLTAEVGPLPSQKRIVKLFDIDGLACAGIGSVLVNDVLDCRPANETSTCLTRLQLSSRADVEIMK